MPQAYQSWGEFEATQRTDTPLYCPSKTAEMAIHAMAGGPADEFRLIIVIGARGTGKTLAAIYSWVALGQRIYAEGRKDLLPLRIACIRDTKVNIERTTIVSFQECQRLGVPIQFIGDKEEALIRPYCHFFFFGMDNRQDADKLQGFQAAGFWLEEVAPAAEIASGIPPEVLGLGVTSIRQPEVPKRILCTLNPPDSEHWILKVEETLMAGGNEDILVARFDMPPAEKSEHFRWLADTMYASDPEARRKWLASADEFDVYRKRNEDFLMSIGREDLVARLVHGEIGEVQTGESVVRTFSRKWHVAKERILAIPGVQIVRCWDGGLCNDSQTEVLTESGWKLFGDMDPQNPERVATRATDGRLEWQYPTRFVRQHYSGQMVEYQTGNVDFCLTPEHLIPVETFKGHVKRSDSGKRLKVPAMDIASGIHRYAHVDLRAQWVASQRDGYGPHGWPGSVYAAFMGWYLSEGCVTPSHDRRVKISIYQKGPNSALEAALRATGLRWRPMKAYGESVGWFLTDQKLAAYLDTMGRHAREKRVHPDVWALGQADLAVFLDAIIAGDGHTRAIRRGERTGERNLNTASAGLAGDVQALAMMAGVYARVFTRPAANATIRDRNGRIHVAHGGIGYRVSIKTKADRALLDPARCRLVPYDGLTYCLTVPNGTLYIRRNGIAHWNGNTPSTVFLQSTPAGNINILGSVQSVNAAMAEHILHLVIPFQSKYGLLPPKRVSNDEFGAGALQRGFTFRDIGDSALMQPDQLRKSEDSARMVIETMLGCSFEPGPVPWPSRREALNTAFHRRGTGDRPLILIDPVENVHLIKSLAGRARYPVNPSTGVIVETIEAAKRASGAWLQDVDALGHGLSVLVPAHEWLKRELPPAPKVQQPRTWLGV